LFCLRESLSTAQHEDIIMAKKAATKKPAKAARTKTAAKTKTPKTGKTAK
jgi:hypothetical protein